MSHIWPRNQLSSSVKWEKERRIFRKLDVAQRSEDVLLQIPLILASQRSWVPIGLWRRNYASRSLDPKPAQDAPFLLVTHQCQDKSHIRGSLKKMNHQIAEQIKVWCSIPFQAVLPFVMIFKTTIKPWLPVMSLTLIHCYSIIPKKLSLL